MDYQINLPEYLAKCINKNKPELHCDGQCLLMQKIKEKENDETKKNIVVYEYSALYIHKEKVVYTISQPKEEIVTIPFFPYRIDYLYNYNTSIFRPPIDHA